MAMSYDYAQIELQKEKAYTKIEVLNEVKSRIQDEAAFFKEIEGDNDYVKGLSYALHVIQREIDRLKGE